MDGLRKAPSKVLVLKMDEPSKIECLSRESSTSKDKEKEKEGQPVSLETKCVIYLFTVSFNKGLTQNVLRVDKSHQDEHQVQAHRPLLTPQITLED